MLFVTGRNAAARHRTPLGTNRGAAGRPLAFQVPFLAGDNDCPRACSRGEAADVLRIAGNDSISTFRNEDDGRVDRVVRSSPTDQYARVTTELFVHRPDIDRVQQSSELCLAPGRIPPHLAYDDSARAQVNSVPLSCAQAGEHPAIVAIDRDERARIQHESSQGVGAPARSPSSPSAKRSSSGVRAPCSPSHVSRNSAKASARNFAPAASASQEERPLPFLRAAWRTRSPSSESNEMLILSTFT